MRPIFKDQKLQKQLETQGFALIQLLDQGQIETLQNLYDSLKSGNEEGFYTSIWSEDRAYREKVDRELKAVLVPAVNRHLNNCKPVFSNFMVKRAMDNSQIGLHQDWTFTDESRFVAVNCWCPLVDTVPGIGPLRVVPGSHKFLSCYRGRNIRSPFDPIQQHIRDQYMTELQVPAGTAVIFDERLLHDSEDNTSGKDRVAVSLVMAPQEAELLHFIQRDPNTNQIDRLLVDASFFTENGLFDKLEDVPTVERIPYQFKGVSEEEFKRMDAKVNGQEGSFWGRIQKLFS